MKKTEMRLCPFIEAEEIRANGGSFFRLVPKKRIFEYRANHAIRMEIMARVTANLANKINSSTGNVYYTEGYFKNKFEKWFKKLLSTRIPINTEDCLILKETFIDDFDEILKTFMNSREEEQSQKLSGDLKAVGNEEVASGSEEIESQKPSGDLKSKEVIVVALELKTGSVRIEFDKQPTVEDINIIHQYLIYKLS